MSKNAQELGKFYGEIDNRIGAIKAGEETCSYKFAVDLCGRCAEGAITVEASDEDDAYEKAMTLVSEKLTAAFPTLQIDYDVEQLC